MKTLMEASYQIKTRPKRGWWSEKHTKYLVKFLSQCQTLDDIIKRNTECLNQSYEEEFNLRKSWFTKRVTEEIYSMERKDYLTRSQRRLLKNLKNELKNADKITEENVVIEAWENRLIIEAAIQLKEEQEALKKAMEIIATHEAMEIKDDEPE